MKYTLRILFCSLIIASMLTSFCFTDKINAYESGDYVYEVQGGQVTIMNYTGTDEIIIIPSVLGGYPVKSIGDHSFSNCMTIKEITVPEGITDIGPNAFSECSNLTQISLPPGITGIEFASFNSCSSLTEIDIPVGATFINSNAFSSCTSLTNITLPDSIKTIETNAFSNCSSLTAITIPKGMTEIVHDTFRYCTSLSNVTIPNSITVIGDWAFRYCSSLTVINIPSSVTRINSGSFADCALLTSAYIPNTVTFIGEQSFSPNPALTIYGAAISAAKDYANSHGINFVSISLPDVPQGLASPAKTDISANLTWDVSALATGYNVYKDGIRVNIDLISSTEYTVSGLSQSETYIFTVKAANIAGLSPNSTSISVTTDTNPLAPDSPTEFYSPSKTTTSILLAWSQVTGVTGYNVYKEKIKINASLISGTTLDVTGLTDNTTYSFTVKAVNTFGESVASPVLIVTTDALSLFVVNEFGELEKYNGTDAEVVIPSDLGIITIGTMSFSDNWNITSVTIPVGVKTIDQAAFQDCALLESVTIPLGLTTIGMNAFSACMNLTSINFPDSITSIDPGAFSNCYKLNNIVLPNSITKIENSTFKECQALSSITIPDSVTIIDYDAFKSCFALTNINIPTSVTRINDYAFAGCVLMTKAIILNNVTSLGGQAFLICPNLTIYGYAGSYVQGYAVTNEIPFSVIRKGDVNNDNIINIEDLTAAKHSLIQILELDDIGCITGDINADKKITISDLLAIKKHILGIEIIGA
jgi:chitodextrinase